MSNPLRPNQLATPGDDFVATLVVHEYGIRNHTKKALFYRDLDTDLYYQISNKEIDRLLKVDHLRPVISATWAWTSQGGLPVIKAVNVTYAGLEVPDTTHS